MKKILFAIILSSFVLPGYAQSQLEKGIAHMENENYVEALKAFEAICKADPKNSGVYYYIGEVHFRQDDYGEAEKAYRKGITANAQCPECFVGLGKLQLDKLDTLGAAKNFAVAIRNDKKNPVIYGLVGDAYLYAKKPDAEKAIKYLEQAKGMNPGIAWFWAHLGHAYEKSGDHGDAMTSYDYAIEKDPTNTEAYIRQARIWAAAKQYDLAIPKLEKAMQLAPNDARPIKDLYELYIETGKYSKVTPLLEKYVTLIGTDIDAKVRLVKFLTFQAKDYAKAIEVGEPLLKSNRDQYTLHRWLAWSYLEKAVQMEAGQANDTMITDSLIKVNYRKSYDHSIELFEEIEKNDTRKSFPTDYENWAKAAFKLGLLEEAAHIYRKYLEFEPAKAAEIYVTLAKAYYDSTDNEQAIAYYKRKAALAPLTNSEMYYLALAYFKIDQYPQSDSMFAKILEVTPNYVQGWWYRARIANKIDSLQTLFLADTFYTKVIECGEIDKEKNKRQLIDAYYYKAVYWVQHDDNAKGKEYFLKILELDPAHEQSIQNLEILKGQRR